jgi:hypothetical protein
MRVAVKQGHRYKATVKVTGWKAAFATEAKVRSFFEDEGFAVEDVHRIYTEGKVFEGTAVRRDKSDVVDDDRILSFEDLGPA